MNYAAPDIEISASVPGTDSAAILKRLALLYGTRAGELAGDRSFGLDWGSVDQTGERAKAILSSEIINKTTKYEPNAQVSKVTWEHDPASGKLKPKVVIKIV